MSSISDKKSSNNKQEGERPVVFFQREVFLNLIQKGKTLDEIYSAIELVSSHKPPTMRTLRTWKTKWLKNQFSITDKRAGRTMIKPSTIKRFASKFKKSGLKSVREFSKVYQMPRSTVNRYLLLSGLHYCPVQEQAKESDTTQKGKKATSNGRKEDSEKERKNTGRCLEWTRTDSGYWMEG